MVLNHPVTPDSGPWGRLAHSIRRGGPFFCAAFLCGPFCAAPFLQGMLLEFMNTTPLHALVTGAGGFIGGHLLRHLRDAGWLADAVRVRRRGSESVDQGAGAGIGEAISETMGEGGDGAVGPERAMQSSSNRIVFHVGGIPGDSGQEPSRLLRANRDLPVELYACAAERGARGFVFVSSAKVLGPANALGKANALDKANALEKDAPHPLAVDASPHPQGLYARSKAEAEALLADAHARLKLPLAVVRPPLVYGPGVGGSFLTLLRWIEAGRPLPFAAARAPRSFVSVANLASALRLIGERASGCGIYHVTDGDDVSMRELCLRLAAGLGRSVRLVPLPRSLFALAARVTGRPGVVDVFDACRIDDGELRRSLGWTPEQSMDQAIDETIRWFRSL